jgi:hypothetical protein
MTRPNNSETYHWRAVASASLGGIDGSLVLCSRERRFGDALAVRVRQAMKPPLLTSFRGATDSHLNVS